MRDYIVTHLGDGSFGFTPRVVRCDTPKEAVLAVVRDLRWTKRRLHVTAKVTRRTAYGPQNWSCSGRWFSDVLHVEQYRPSDWGSEDVIIRLNRSGEYVKHVRNTDLVGTVKR